MRACSTDDPLTPAPVAEIGAEYVRQVVDLSPGQRKRYLAQVRTMVSIEVPGAGGAYRPFDRTVAQVKEADVQAWLIGWDGSLKTKANYYGLLYGIFGYAVEQGHRTATHAPPPRGCATDQAVPGTLRFLDRGGVRDRRRLAEPDGGLLRVAVGTGLRCGELTALWVSDVDL